ncbi:LacI family transcriptional regulator [Nakamurella flava]|uniref:LacI family transcriptional regulator n=1 Tax=Nakamurella flava TaxID=2576308 RepID=A0A4U6QG74_9ACTN|nr:LacI family DNA-binding transcriptional regulator [Nakamurella flava]TKV59200.1 LacI family transcriptional regulator [Nakamurella flava]
MSERVTIRTVAARAGVSKSLVSLVLQGSPHVSPAKRGAVEQAMAELDYRPNLLARSLSGSRTGLVGVLLDDLRNPWFVDCLEALRDALHEQGRHTLLAAAGGGQGIDSAAVPSFRELRVDGLVVVGTVPGAQDLLRAARLPTVVAGNRDVDLPGVDVIANDDLTGAQLAVQHLVDLGHRRIAHLAGRFGVAADLRAQGYRAAMADHGWGDLVRVETADASESSAYSAAVRLLDADPDRRPTAIVAANDLSAIAAQSAALDRGLRVPDDVSIVGYDDTWLASLRAVALTSVDNANAEVGRRAAAAFDARIADPDRPATLELLTPTLRVRGSTGIPPA